jgi:chromosome segregation ATPase
VPEKVGIEDYTKTYNRLLSDAQNKLNDLNVKHAKTISDLQRQFSNINSSIAKLKREVPTDPERQKQIKTEIASLTVRKGAVQKQITDENTWYGWDSTRLEQDVKNNQTQLDNLGEQEKNLLDNIETVQGYVSVQWMSVWQMINIYIPYLWVWVVGVCVLLFIFSYFSKRRTINAW